LRGVVTTAAAIVEVRGPTGPNGLCAQAAAVAERAGLRGGAPNSESSVGAGRLVDTQEDRWAASTKDG